MTRHPTDHPDWCGQGHHCGLNEHRGAPVTLDHTSGRAVLTRVRATTAQHAEVRLTVRLDPDDQAAARQLAALLSDLDTVLTRAARRTRPALTPVSAGPRCLAGSPDAIG